MGLWLLAILSFGASAANAQTIDRAEAFGNLERVWDVRVSPDGKLVSFLAPAGGEEPTLVIADPVKGESKAVLSGNRKGLRLTSCDWANNTRLLCHLYGIVNVTGEMLPFSRLIGVNTDGSNVKILDVGQAQYGLSQFQGHIVDWLPDDPDHVLIEAWLNKENRKASRLGQEKEGLAVIKLDINTGRTSIYEEPQRDIVFWMSDGHGNIRFKADGTRTPGGYAGADVRYALRTDGPAWQTVAVGSVLDPGSFDVEAFDADGKSLYALKEYEGRPALFKLALDGSRAEQLVFAHPKVDVDGVVTAGRYNRVVGVRYTLDAPMIGYFDEARKKLSQTLARSLPGDPIVSIVSESWDGEKMIVHTSGDSDAGRYYFLDRKANRMDEIGVARPLVDQLRLAPVKPVSYPAADGTQIPAFLTMPQGVSGPIKAIVLPHGGPQARDAWGFDWLAQYFASLGYAVLQPNFRGSYGYGSDWYAENGFKSWNIAIGDVNSGAKWLVSQKIADPSKLAIVGWSYGGYAALLGGITEPSLYHAVIAIAPVTDLELLVENSRHFSNFRLVDQYVGSGPHIHEGSPAQRAGEMGPPVLMFHGDRDMNVDIGHTELMASKLEAAGKPVQKVIYPDLAHDLQSSEVRIDMLRKSAQFLEANLR
jgi:dipeptidyl aminopeptidase/acylaminoacyl peptidase